MAVFAVLRKTKIQNPLSIAKKAQVVDFFHESTVAALKRLNLSAGAVEQNPVSPYGITPLENPHPGGFGAPPHPDTVTPPHLPGLPFATQRRAKDYTSRAADAATQQDFPQRTDGSVRYLFFIPMKIKRFFCLLQNSDAGEDLGFFAASHEIVVGFGLPERKYVCFR